MYMGERGNMKEKILSREAFSILRSGMQSEGKTVVLCHGVFDLLHYGHIEHLEEAKAQGDILVVSVTAAKYVNKGPGRPYFSDEQRMHFLASLECVDYVLLSEAVTVHDIVRAVRPNVYVKGQEYAKAEDDVTGNIGAEQEIVESYGGHIYFTNGAVYSSTKLLNNFFNALPEEVVAVSQRLCRKYGEHIAADVRTMVEDFAKLHILVIGDVIIDEYNFCKVQGLTTKDAVMSTRYDYQERYMGGALAIARHLGNFAGQVTLLSMIGQERAVAEDLQRHMPDIECQFVQEKHFVTPVKTRFLRKNAIRDEYEKLFSVNHLLQMQETSKINYTNFYQKLDELLPQYDLVVVCDYGHGLLGQEAIERIERQAKYLAVNCQTNSSNYGLNVITKYTRADAFVVDEKELQIAVRQAAQGNEAQLTWLQNQMKSRYAWVTEGANGALGRRADEMVQIPAVTLNVKDTVGAGDAFYSLAALAAAGNLPIDIATLLANVAGAIKTNVIGNKASVQKVDLLKFLGTVLNV